MPLRLWARHRQYLYTLSRTGKLLRTDVNDPADMRLLASVRLPFGLWGGLLIFGSRAYCLGNGKLAIVDISEMTLENVIIDGSLNSNEPGVLLP